MSLCGEIGFFSITSNQIFMISYSSNRSIHNDTVVPTVFQALYHEFCIIIIFKPGFVKLQILTTSLLYFALSDFLLLRDFICHPFYLLLSFSPFFLQCKYLRFDQYFTKSVICLLIQNGIAMWSTKSSSVVIDLSLLSFNLMHRAEILV